MPMDETDKKLLRGGGWILALVGVLYYAPYIGYQEWHEKEDKAREQLKTTAMKFNQYYPPMHSNYFGAGNTDSLPAPDLPPITQVEGDYAQANDQYKHQIAKTEDLSRMKFPIWTEIPDASVNEPGVYFQNTWEHHRQQLATEWNKAKVECLVPDVGFQKYQGLVTNNANKAKELLRELYIAEKIINICIEAKVKQEEFEHSRGFQNEAFMRIISVSPEESNTAGPSALVPNPRYNPEEKLPTSERFRKFNVKVWKNFIQEYPVRIVLQCDVNSFMRFLHRVRRKDQFLVIRNLEIISPFMKDSKADRVELVKHFPAGGAEYDEGPDGIETEKKKRGPTLDDKHIVVEMSASGMDFFDPAEFPFGIYSSRPVKAAPVKKKYTIVNGM